MRLRRFLCVLLLAAGAAIPVSAATELKVYAPQAIAAVLKEIGPQFERDTGHKLAVTADGAEALVRRVESGEGPDVFVGPVEQVNRLVQARKVEAETRVGVARLGPVQWFGSIGSQSRDPAAAWELLKFLTSPDTDAVFKAQGMERD